MLIRFNEANGGRRRRCTGSPATPLTQEIRMAGLLSRILGTKPKVSEDDKLAILEYIDGALDSLEHEYPAAYYVFCSTLAGCITVFDEPGDDKAKIVRLQHNISEARPYSANATQLLDLAAMKLCVLYLREPQKSRALHNAFEEVFIHAKVGAVSYRVLSDADALPPTNARTKRILASVNANQECADEVTTMAELVAKMRAGGVEHGIPATQTEKEVQLFLAMFDIDDEYNNGAQDGPVRVIKEAVKVDDPLEWGRRFLAVDAIKEALVRKDR